MHFEYECPVFALVERFTTDPTRPTNVTFHNPVTLTAPGLPAALAVFTDRDAAEQFRADHAPRHQVFQLDTREMFLVFLRGARRVAGLIAFDPLRDGLKTRAAAIEDVIRSAASQTAHG